MAKATAEQAPAQAQVQEVPQERNLGDFKLDDLSFEELHAYVEKRKSEVVERMKKEILKYKISFDMLFPEVKIKERKPRSSNLVKDNSEKSEQVIKYRKSDTEVWSGRGRPPAFIVDAKAARIDIEQWRVKEPEQTAPETTETPQIEAKA